MPLINRHIENVNRFVADACGITYEQIIGKDRSRVYVLPRQVAHYLSRKYLKNAPYQEIANLSGKRNHATIIHSVRLVHQILETNTSESRMVKEVESKFVVEVLPRIKKSEDKPFDFAKGEYNIQFQDYKKSIDAIRLASEKFMDDVTDVLHQDNQMEGWLKAKLRESVKEAKEKLTKAENSFVISW